MTKKPMFCRVPDGTTQAIDALRKPGQSRGAVVHDLVVSRPMRIGIIELAELVSRYGADATLREVLQSEADK